MVEDEMVEQKMVSLAAAVDPDLRSLNRGQLAALELAKVYSATVFLRTGSIELRHRAWYSLRNLQWFNISASDSLGGLMWMPFLDRSHRFPLRSLRFTPHVGPIQAESLPSRPLSAPIGWALKSFR